MAIASSSTTVKFHEFPSGDVVHNYQPNTQVEGSIRSISWSKDGNWLAVVPWSGHAAIISVKDELKLIHSIQTIEEPSCASFQTTTKKNIAVGTKSGQVLIYDIKTKTIKKSYPKSTSPVTRVEFTAKDGHVVAACEHGEAYIFSNVQNTVSGTFKVPRSQTISALRTHPIKRNYIIAGSNEGVVTVWDINTNKSSFFTGSHKGPITGVTFSPINSDLVVSIGLDRQFCFYDIRGNKCIGNIFVENSMTSVDFSPDGKFVVMGSSKGKIVTYDTRNIQEPVHSFLGHNGPVENLAFKKCGDLETSFNMSVENIQKTVEPKNESGSFNLLAFNEQSAKGYNSQNSVSVEDSFLAALGIGKNGTPDSCKQDGSYKSVDGSKILPPQKSTPVAPSQILQERIKIKFTSTPDLPNYEELPLVSPIPHPDSKSSTVDNTTLSLQEFIKNVIREETKGLKEEVKQFKQQVEHSVKEEVKVLYQQLKEEFKYYSTHQLAELRQVYLDLVMKSVKDSIKVENLFFGLREELRTSEVPQSENSLLEENLMLKEKITRLEEEIASFKMIKFD